MCENYLRSHVIESDLKKVLKIHIRFYYEMMTSCNATKSMIWVKVLLDIHLVSGYACDCVHVVLLIEWWNTFFPFNLIGFGVDGDMFRWEMSLMLMLEASTFFIICVNYLSLVYNFSNNCFNFHLVEKGV